MTEKDRDHFMQLEVESRSISEQLLNIVERRNAVASNLNRTILNEIPNFFPEFETWVIQTGEELMIQLRRVVNEMAVVRRRIIEKDMNPSLSFAVDQEYHRKLQLLETLKSIGEFPLEDDLKFFTSFKLAWRCDCEYGYLF